MFFYDTPILPQGFSLPSKYKDMAVDGLLPQLTPWVFLCEDMATSLSYYGAMMLQVRDRVLVPYAMINDQSGLYNEGWVVLACFDGADTSGNPKVYIYDYSRPPKAGSGDCPSFESFDHWLAYAESESARYKAQQSTGRQG